MVIGVIVGAFVGLIIYNLFLIISSCYRIENIENGAKSDGIEGLGNRYFHCNECGKTFQIVHTFNEIYVSQNHFGRCPNGNGKKVC